MTVTRPWSSLASCSKTRGLTSISVPSQSLHLSTTRTSTLFPSWSSCRLAWQRGFSFGFVDVAAASNITWETAQTKSEFSLRMPQAPSPTSYQVRSPFHGPFSSISKASLCLTGEYILIQLMDKHGTKTTYWQPDTIPVAATSINMISRITGFRRRSLNYKSRRTFGPVPCLISLALSFHCCWIVIFDGMRYFLANLDKTLTSSDT